MVFSLTVSRISINDIMSASMPYDLTNESNLRQFSNYYAGNLMATNNISDDRGNGRKEQITEMQQIVETSMP